MIDHNTITKESAHDILSRLVATLTTSPKGLERYSELFDNDLDLENPAHGLMAVRDLLFSCMREQVFDLFRGTHGHIPRHEAIRSHSGEDHIENGEKGVYLRMIHGEDDQWRFYVGQSSNLRAGNFHKRDENQEQNQDIKPISSLHEYAMKQQNKWDSLLVLATLPKSLPLAFHQTEEKRMLLLNVLEMWCALLFHTMQKKDMLKWHMYRDYSTNRTEGKRQWHGLNVALPLNHVQESGESGRNDEDDEEWARYQLDLLVFSDDPMAKEYAETLVVWLQSKQSLPRMNGSLLKVEKELPASVDVVRPSSTPRGPRTDELESARRRGMVVGAAFGFGVAFVVFSILNRWNGGR